MRYPGVRDAASFSNARTLYPCDRLRESATVRSGTRIPRCARFTQGRSGVVVSPLLDLRWSLLSMDRMARRQRDVWESGCGQETDDIGRVCSLPAVIIIVSMNTAKGRSSCHGADAGVYVEFPGLKNDESDCLSTD
jgi:hypothetical protein